MTSLNNLKTTDIMHCSTYEIVRKFGVFNLYLSQLYIYIYIIYSAVFIEEVHVSVLKWN